MGGAATGYAGVELPVHEVSVPGLKLTNFSVAIAADPSLKAGIEQVSRSALAFELKTSRFYLPLGQSNYWFAFKLRNGSAEAVSRVIRMDEVFMDQVDLYRLVNGQWQREPNGIQVPMDQRSIPNRLPSFLVTLQPGETQSYYLFTYPKWELLTAGVEVLDLKQAVETEIWQTAAYFVYFGVAGGVLIYNLFLLITLRDRLYLFYVLYVANFLIFALSYSGFNLYFMSDPQAHYHLAVHISLSVTFLALFISQLLDAKVTIPRLSWVLKGISILFVALALLIYLDLAYYKLIVLSGMPITLIFLLISFYGVYKKIPLASYLLAAMGWYIAGLFLIAGVNLGAVPYNFFTRYAYLLGSMIELLVFSLALAYRVRLLQQEKDSAHRQLINNEKGAKERLERQVYERTAQLAQANDTKDRFFSIISHDLRGPMGSLSVFFNEMVTQPEDIDKQMFQSIRNTTKNTHQLLENLLVWARGQRGEIEFHPQSIALEPILKANLGLFDGIAQQKGIQLGIDCDPKLYIRADLEMVTTIVRNLLNNALKFTPAGGSVQLLGRLEGSWVQIELVDSGKGVDAQMQKDLFRLDRKVRSSLGTNSEVGSGLGLILCADFVKRHGGEIGVESVPGQGSRFWFTLPQGSAGEALVADSEAIMRAQLARMRVLIVDDNDLHRGTSAAVFKELGVDFEVAVSGLDALEQYKKQPFDLVLMDIDMPGMNGVETTEAIRQLAPEALVVALSSYSKLELDRLAQDSPFDGYLNKPLEKGKLLSSIYAAHIANPLM
ncbi:MAG: 7TM diverse intracellular signaling domain-containing protein [bacterium]|nr:7TM diverse intracellular signaling domain-containing protein [bacterium]